ncbi:MAG: competence/damage-inducible protein A [Candidatus Omnitrophica bacterium]|nr:competence/damage-inducible protein A [Candidatus Omnitrophota bacterium]
MKSSVIEIIALGSELLRGEVSDSTAALISERLTRMGLAPSYHTTVRDEERAIKEAMLQALSRASVVILIGGLGPTFDDITRETVASFLSLPLVDLPHVKDGIRRYFKKVNRKLLPSCLGVARIPKASRIIRNRIGFAPGFIVQTGGRYILALPGVPLEAVTMFDEEVRPALAKLGMAKSYAKSLLFKVAGLSETELLDKVKSVFDTCDLRFDCGIYPKYGEVHFRVSLRAPAKKGQLSSFKRLGKAIESRLGPFLFSREDIPLEEAVGRSLRKQRKTIAVAESCTGGLVGKRFTDIPQASDYFLGGVVAYSNKSKERILSVPREVIRREGAVSKTVAGIMANSVRRVFGADIGAAITGIAGPTGGSSRKPVGTVWIAISTKAKTITKKFLFPNERSIVRQKASQALLDLIRRQLLR